MSRSIPLCLLWLSTVAFGQSIELLQPNYQTERVTLESLLNNERQFGEYLPGYQFSLRPIEFVLIEETLIRPAETPQLMEIPPHFVGLAIRNGWLPVLVSAPTKMSLVGLSQVEPSTVATPPIATIAYWTAMQMAKGATLIPTQGHTDAVRMMVSGQVDAAVSAEVFVARYEETFNLVLERLDEFEIPPSAFVANAAMMSLPDASRLIGEGVEIVSLSSTRYTPFDLADVGVFDSIPSSW